MMDKVELCNDGRCNRVRMGGDRHPTDTLTNNFTKQTKVYRVKMAIYPFIALGLALTFNEIIQTEQKWTVIVSAMSIVATIMVAETNRHFQNKHLQTNSLFKVFELLSSPDIRRSREIIHEEYCRLAKNNLTIKFENNENLEDLEDRVDNVLSAFDQVSATVLNGLLDEELFFDTYGEMIVRDWNTLKTEIDVRQHDNEKTLRHFTILKNKFEPRIEEKLRKPYCRP